MSFVNSNLFRTPNKKKWASKPFPATLSSSLYNYYSTKFNSIHNILVKFLWRYERDKSFVLSHYTIKSVYRALKIQIFFYVPTLNDYFEKFRQLKNPYYRARRRKRTRRIDIIRRYRERFFNKFIETQEGKIFLRSSYKRNYYPYKKNRKNKRKVAYENNSSLVKNRGKDYRYLSNGKNNKGKVRTRHRSSLVFNKWRRSKYPYYFYHFRKNKKRELLRDKSNKPNTLKKYYIFRYKFFPLLSKCLNFFYTPILYPLFFNLVQLDSKDNFLINTRFSNGTIYHPMILAKYVMRHLKYGSKFLNIIRPILRMPKLKGYPRNLIGGFRIMGLGRFTRRQRADQFVFNYRSIPFSTLSESVTFVSQPLRMKYGISNIKIWFHYKPYNEEENQWINLQRSTLDPKYYGDRKKQKKIEKALKLNFNNNTKKISIGQRKRTLKSMKKRASRLLQRFVNHGSLVPKIQKESNDGNISSHFTTLKFGFLLEPYNWFEKWLYYQIFRAEHDMTQVDFDFQTYISSLSSLPLKLLKARKDKNQKEILEEELNKRLFFLKGATTIAEFKEQEKKKELKQFAID